MSYPTVTKECFTSIHGHSGRIELFLTSNKLDDGGMILDFGTLKEEVKDLINSFDHSMIIYTNDDPNYIAAIKQFSKRYVILPANSTAERMAEVIMYLTGNLVRKINKNVSVCEVIFHETATGYASCSDDGAYGTEEIDPTKIIFSDSIKESWKNPDMLKNITYFVKE